MRGPNLVLLIARIPPKIMLLSMTALALSAGVLVQSEFQKRDALLNGEREKLSHKETSPLLVAAIDIPEGATINSESLEVRTIDSKTLPAGALQYTGAALGMQARVPIAKGESILSQCIKAPQKAQGFQTKIPDGFRAVTFPVDASTGVAGFLTPDCRVDILAQMGSGQDANAIPVLSDVQVVAVGQTYQKKPGLDEAQPANCVTVAVRPSDGAKLVNAMSAGRLYCLMRNQVDHSPLAVRDVTTVIPRAKSNLDNQMELTSLAPLKENRLPPPAIPELKADDPKLHNVEAWAAAKKDQLTVPQQ